MSTQTGIRATEKLLDFFGQCRDGRIRMVKVVIEKEALVMDGHWERQGTWEQDWEALVLRSVEENQPCYLLFRYCCAVSYWLILFSVLFLISWSRDLFRDWREWTFLPFSPFPPLKATLVYDCETSPVCSLTHFCYSKPGKGGKKLRVIFLSPISAHWPLLGISNPSQLSLFYPTTTLLSYAPRRKQRQAGVCRCV